MRPSSEHCSASDSIAYRGLTRFAIGVLGCIVAACSREDAEVGSDWHAAVDAGDSRSSFADGAVPSDAIGDVGEAGIGRCDPLAPLRLYYWNLTASSPSNNINYIVKIENATGAGVALGGLEVRYYFTNELAMPWETEIFYTDTCCSNKITDFNADIAKNVYPIPARANADAYLGIGFAPSLGMLASGDAVQVELGFHAPGFSRSMTQANDHSYGASATGTQAQWNACPGAQCDAKFTTCTLTLHRNGVLVWGTPP